MTDHRAAGATHGLTRGRFLKTATGVIALTDMGHPQTTPRTGAHGAGYPLIPSMPPFHGLDRRASAAISVRAVDPIAACCLDPTGGICNARPRPPVQ